MDCSGAPDWSVIAQTGILFVALTAMAVGYKLTKEEDMAYGDHWFGARKSATEKRIAKLEKWYPFDQVRFLVEVSLRETRSPGRQAAYRAWLAEHPVVVEEKPNDTNSSTDRPEDGGHQTSPSADSVPGCASADRLPSA